MGDFQHAGPDAHEGQVQDQQHHIADVHAGGDAQKKIRMLLKKEGPGRIPWISRAPIMTRPCPEPERRERGAGSWRRRWRRCWRLRCRYPFDDSRAKTSPGVLEILFSVRRPAWRPRWLPPRAWSKAKKPMAAPRRIEKWIASSPPVRQEIGNLIDIGRRLGGAFGHLQNLGDGKEPHRDTHEN